MGGRAKRAADLALALPLTLALAPALVGIAIWVRRDSPGPALFRQRRIGYAGRPFTLLKFRTMVVGAEGMGAGLAVVAGDEQDHRAPAAPCGACRWTSFPQLLNVLWGDMSLVGPRPTVESQVRLYDDRQRRRLLARPGVTGLAQVSGRNAIPWSERIEIDIGYVDRWSMRRDLGDPGPHRARGAGARGDLQGRARRVRPVRAGERDG